MEIICTIEEMRRWVRAEREKGATIGLVPTMGYLHEGHLSLVRRAREQCDRVVMSIFVNPLQFGPREDYDRYPRDLERDARLAREAGVDVIFHPSVEEMYPRPNLTYVTVERLSETLCGQSRPGHFRGVATVVSKLFHIVQPDRAYFGQKDIQQLRVIEQMVEDLNFPVVVEGCPIVREPDGLAMSSRNVYLSPSERQQAPVIYASLRRAQQAYAAGERDAEKLLSLVREGISQAPDARIDYIRLVDRYTLDDVQRVDGPAILAVAVWFGSARLIDNIILGA
ncbi:MAG TPA: pantoate--beta-alanine ligase [Symbiobacteriaceae bacterium]